jgi:hypothetical protein
VGRDNVGLFVVGVVVVGDGAVSSDSASNTVVVDAAAGVRATPTG